jgi:hypothetical protein
MNNDQLANRKPKSDDLKDLTNKAKVKGIGSNSDPSALREVRVNVAPSSICRFYAEEQYDSLQFAIAYKTGVSDAQLPFTSSDLFAYYSILIRERINDVNKRRVLFSPKDNDIKIPHFFHLMLASLGEVTDERRHLWLSVEYQPESWTEADIANFKLYRGVETEKEFVYAMSKQLRLMERYGLVNGSALPRGLDGVTEFMLFLWAESRLYHPEPEVEPGLSVLASLLKMSRDQSILNPYIAYGTEEAYRVFVRDMTLLRSAE